MYSFFLLLTSEVRTHCEQTQQTGELVFGVDCGLTNVACKLTEGVLCGCVQSRLSSCRYSGSGSSGAASMRKVRDRETVTQAQSVSDVCCGF